MNTLSVGVVIVQDQFGHVAVGSTADPDAPIYLGGGFRNANGDPIADYSGPGRLVKSWAKQNGLSYTAHQVDLDLDSRTLVAWTVLP